MVSRASVLRILAVAAIAALPSVAGAEPTVSAIVDRSRVDVGEQVIFSLTITDDERHDIRPPAIPAIPGVEMRGPQGPSVSQEFSMINGRTSRRVSLEYVWALRPAKSGEFTIPALAVLIDGQSYETEPIRVAVGGRAGGDAPEKGGAAPFRLDLSLSRTTAWQGQAIIAEYTLYERANVQITNRHITKDPTFSGAWAEVLLDARQSQTPRREQVINGVPYVVMPVMRIALSPTSAGRLTVPSMEFSAVVLEPTRLRNFWGEPVLRQREASVRTPERTIEVRPLPPNAPSGFAGAVGTFRLTSRVDKASVAQGDPVSWTIILEGDGNIKGAGEPIVPPLDAFRAYDPQASVVVNSEGERYGGRKTWERVLLPRHSGEVEVPPASFVYFDPNAGAYRTVTTSAQVLAVSARTDADGGAAFALTPSEIREVGKDIRFIQSDRPVLEDQRRRIWDNPWYWYVQLVPIGAVVVAWGIRRRRIRLMGDPARLREVEGRNAARKRLKRARNLVRTGERAEAVADVRNAVTELVGGAIGHSAFGLTTEDIRAALAANDAPDDLIADTLALLERCDRARYAPSALTPESAEEIVRAGEEVIERLMRTVRARSRRVRA